LFNVWPQLTLHEVFFHYFCVCYRFSVYSHPCLLSPPPPTIRGGFKMLLVFTAYDDRLSESLIHWKLHWVLIRAHGLQNPPLSRWVELSFTPWLTGRSSRTSFYTVSDSVTVQLSVIIWRVFVAIQFPAYAIAHVLRIGVGETMGDTGGRAASRWNVACSSRLPLSELLALMRKTNASLWLVISPYSVNDSQLCSPIFYSFSMIEYETITTNVLHCMYKNSVGRHKTTVR
jgi:hypothetical protein